MLAASKAMLSTPGSNLKNDAGGADWLFILPDLAIGRVLCLGQPQPASLPVLAQFAEEVTVLLSYSSTTKANEAIAGQSPGPNIHRVVSQRSGRLPFDGQCIDLVYLYDNEWLDRVRKEGPLQAELRRVMTPSGLLYAELNGLTARLFAKRIVAELAHGFSGPRLLWVTPQSGSIDTVVPAWDETTIRYFTERRLFSPSVNIPAIKRLKSRLNGNKARDSAPQGLRVGRQDSSSAPARLAGRKLVKTLQETERFLLERDLGRRYAVLAGVSDHQPLDSLPHYVRAAAERVGLNLDEYRWGVIAGGRYASRKVTFFLFSSQQQGRPDYVVKMVRRADLNRRLENEGRALRRLAQTGFGQYHLFPQVVFSSSHRTLAMLGQTAIPGTSLGERSALTADCPLARAAIDWLIDLAAHTAGPAGSQPQSVSETMALLLAQFIDIYRPTPEIVAFLAGQVDVLARHAERLPAVFQHGDPGPWNILVTPDARIAFLDWESAEPAGMPLWDLFYLLRSLAVSIGRQKGIPDRLESFQRQFLEASPFAQLVVESISHCRRQIGLPTSLTVPLFYSCWMHRALKEATRLAPSQLSDGHFIRLLQWCIEQQDSWTLGQLSEPQPAEASAPSNQIQAPGQGESQ